MVILSGTRFINLFQHFFVLDRVSLHLRACGLFPSKLAGLHDTHVTLYIVHVALLLSMQLDRIEAELWNCVARIALLDTRLVMLLFYL